MNPGRVTLTLDQGIARIVFDRPEARNAMTKPMYADLHEICRTLAGRDDIRLAILRGAGGEAFVAGSDIGIFESFETGADGVAYEAEMEIYTRALADLPFPTLAVIEGWAVGGGLNLASVCDLRIATPDARMGVPIAKTVGNCLSIENYARLVAGFGASRAKRLLMVGDFLGAEEALACGFIFEIVARDTLEDRIAALAARIAGNAPITLRVSKQAIGRVLDAGVLPDADDLIAEAYGSADFRTGIAAFKAKARPAWTGR
ncbi:enoyl-CoA hydratase [Arsenicitalea aurantiaca]|uniref:Enoyl-CoA hydratase n=1 Tax=Arsenicitalea aurantiaca TaxID=1783274 RepID=A0A433X473_9HYPH|nr:enoyl-CoA hydratase [Arsenicitalea aurantiaca]RUT28864.1 enoyl-CoA hydratase [Arsenicitalea aurantiaca]